MIRTASACALIFCCFTHEGLQLLADFRPQWHHIFPRKYLAGKINETEKIEALANIAVIGPAINIRISAKAPMDYIDRYKITDEKLEQQFIEPEIKTLPPDKFESWLAARAERLAKQGNDLLQHLHTTLS